MKNYRVTEDVVNIRQLLKKRNSSYRDIAESYGVNHHCIGRIARNEGWRNV